MGHSNTTKENSTNKLGKMAREHTNKWMQGKLNNFGEKYGNEENITKKPNRLATWGKI